MCVSLSVSCTFNHIPFVAVMGIPLILNDLWSLPILIGRVALVFEEMRRQILDNQMCTVVVFVFFSLKC